MTEELKKEFSKLRFLDENGETYPEWEEKKVSDVFNISRGKVIAKSSVSQEQNELSKYPIYSSQTLNDGIMGYGKDYNFEGDSLTWTTDGAYAGKVRYRTGKYSCTNVCGVLQAKDDFSGMANKLMENIIGLKTPLHVVKVGNPKLMSNIMADIEISLPSLPEQTKIANLLSKMDERIEAQSKLVELLKKQKQGYSQKIFNGSLRFKKDDGTDFDDWEEKELGEVLSPVRYEKVTNPSSYNLLTVKLHLKGIVPTSNRPNDTENGRPYYKRELGELLVGRQNFHNGGFGIVESNTAGLIASNAISGYRSNENVYFVMYYLRYAYKSFSMYLEGTGQKEIPQKVFESVPLVVPSLPEQEKIAAFLSSLDKRIDEELNILEQLKLEKNGYMQRVLV